MIDEHPFIGLIVGALMCVLIGAGIGVAIIKQTAVEKGFAFYHPQNGHFTWKENQGTTTKVINLGVYDDKTNTFTLPSGRVTEAPITNKSNLDEMP